MNLHNKNAVVLLSGGLDSMVAAGLVREQGFAIHALTIDYGQRHRRELSSAEAVAAALGVDAVLLTPRCADPLYRRAVKVSMGSVFHVPWTRLTSWPEDVGLLREDFAKLPGLIRKEKPAAADVEQMGLFQ